VGPSSISTGRADYNEAINKTEDEQMLLALIKERYGETFSLLAVNSVTASVRFTTKAGIELGFGPERNYTGELTPFSGGVAYEENPTISYAPVHGENYVRQLMSPIPQEHVSEGIALPYPPAGPAGGDNIRIHSSEDKPKHATVAVKYRGYWFYIDEADRHTKMFYIMVRSLWSISISSAKYHEGAPLLTIPVG
jgi:hypothetical protein